MTKKEPTIVTGYKGFDKNMQCRGMQYEEGKTFKSDEASLCNSGLHFCEYPLDVFGYYAPADSLYAEVEAVNPTDEHKGDSKRVTTELRIKAALNIPALVKASIDFLSSKIDNSKTESNTGDQSAATNTGYRSAATNTGDRSAAKVEGEESIAMSCGIEGKAAGSLGSWLVLSEWKVEGGKWHRVDTQCVKVDGEKIKVDTWYKLQGGEFVEVDDE
jgi:hypothetical protein